MCMKEDDVMNLDICMKIECRNCKRRLKCFKEEVDYNKYQENKIKGNQVSKLQSKEKVRENRRRIQKDKSKY